LEDTALLDKSQPEIKTTHKPIVTSNIGAGLFWSFVGVLIFSLTLPVTKTAIIQFEPTQLVVWRGLIASMLAGSILVYFKPKFPNPAQWKDLTLCAMGTVFGFPGFLALGLQTVPASHSAIVVGLLPLATTIISTIFTKERPSIAFWLVSLLGTAITLVFVLKQTDGSPQIGHIYLFISVILAATGYTFGGRLAKQIGGWQVSCWVIMAALPALIICAFFVELPSLGENMYATISLFYVAFFSQLIGFFAWYRGMQLAGIARASQIQLLQLFLTIITSSILLSEALEWDVIVFAGFVALSVWLGSKLRVRT
jgi:drug/metabolite transporter (DMT)-like permease